MLFYSKYNTKNGVNFFGQCRRHTMLGFDLIVVIIWVFLIGGDRIIESQPGSDPVVGRRGRCTGRHFTESIGSVREDAQYRSDWQ